MSMPPPPPFAEAPPHMADLIERTDSAVRSRGEPTRHCVTCGCVISEGTARMHEEWHARRHITRAEAQALLPVLEGFTCPLVQSAASKLKVIAWLR